MAKIDHEQSLDSFEAMLRSKLSDTEELSETKTENLKNHHALSFPERSITVSKPRKSGFRRCGGLSEY